MPRWCSSSDPLAPVETEVARAAVVADQLSSYHDRPGRNRSGTRGISGLAGLAAAIGFTQEHLAQSDLFGRDFHEFVVFDVLQRCLQ